jgi:predicted nucleic acid-binding protein
MSGVGLISIDQLDELVLKYPNFRNGCLLDTNILVSASLTIDPMNEAAELLIQKLASLKIPVYSNVNIRAEFLEIQRRVLIPECLVEFYEISDELEDIAAQKLKSVQTSYRKALDSKKVYKFPDERVKEFRDLLSMKPIHGRNGWLYFCETFLAPQLNVVWDEVVALCGLNFIKIREGEVHPLLTSKVSWDGVTDIMGKNGVGSADAMILNLLLSSKLELVATADGDIQYMSDSLHSQGKFVLEI